MPQLQSRLQKRTKVVYRLSRVLMAMIAVTYSISTILSLQVAGAATLQQQIESLRVKNQQAQKSASNLDVEAANFNETIQTLQAQISSLQAQIRENTAKRDEIQGQIVAAEAEIVIQKAIMGKNIRAMYLEGDMSTIEMLATSKNLSHYLDKAQYRTVVQDNIKETLEKINALKESLAIQKIEQEKLLAEQQTMQSQLAVQSSEQARLLSLNQSEQAAVDANIQTNNARIKLLQKQQAAENARLFSRAGSSIRNVPDTTGYPWANVQPFPNSFPDPWGMYKRQCVSYTAWKVYKDGKRMPYWGGRGNAKNWANNARAEGIPVSSTPKRGDIAVSTRGTYGHVMYVENVLSDGRIQISQYNAGWTGKYSEATISPAGLEFVRFQ